MDENLNVTFGTHSFNDQAGLPFAEAAGRLDWFGDADQVVLFGSTFGSTDSDPALFVAEFLGEGGIGFVTSLAVSAQNCPDFFSTQVGGVALGDFNFDLLNPESTPPNLEIAALVACGTASAAESFEVQIFAADPSNDFALTLLHSYPLDLAPTSEPATSRPSSPATRRAAPCSSGRRRR